MKLVRFFIVQSVLLGSCAFAAWALLLSRGTWPFILSLDTLHAAGAGIVLTAAFLLSIATPLQLTLGSNRSLVFRILVGAASGPAGVWLGLLVLSNYPIGWEWYGSRAWALHVVFAGVGVYFAVLWHRRLRPNNSFKPMPLRGTA